MKYEPLSREFLLSRGSCCHKNCVNCPYKKVLIPIPEKESLGHVSKLVKEIGCKPVATR